MADGGDSGENPPTARADMAAEKAAEVASDVYRAVKDQPWVEDALRRASSLKQSVQEAADSAVAAARIRLSGIGSTSQAHFLMTLGYMDDLKEGFRVYEDAFFGKVKEGILVAADHPAISCGVATGLGLVAFKRPRRFLFYGAQRMFVSEEKLLSRADARAKELRESIDRLKFEGRKLEDRVLKAEEEMIRGRDKLRNAGSLIRGIIRSNYKIERQEAGLRDIINELPRRDASQFRSQVSSLTSDLKQVRAALNKIVTKITNYGISMFLNHNRMKSHEVIG